MLCCSTKNSTNVTTSGFDIFAATKDTDHCNIPDWLGWITFFMQIGLMVVPGSILFYFIVKKLKKVGNVGIILVLLILSAPCFWLQMFFFTKIVRKQNNLNG